MRQWTAGRVSAPILAAVIVLAAARTAGAGESRTSVSAGLRFDYLSRTITWDGNAYESKVTAGLVSARAEFGFGPGLSVEIGAGLSLPNFNGLIFRNLPISLDYQAGAAPGLLLGAAVRARLASWGGFEIEGAGRFVYSLGLAKTWALTGFAVDGSAKGKAGWFEASAGPRISYVRGGRFVPYVAVAADWFSGSFKMDETLGDLSGRESKKVKGKGFVAVSLGADYAASRRVSLGLEGVILPYRGGADIGASAAFSYRF